MSVIGLNHVNIRSQDVLATAEFYAQLLGLRPSAVPASVTASLAMSIPPEKAQWLFDAHDKPIIHIRHYDTPPGADGPVDHIALNCADLDGTIARLTEQGIQYRRFDGLGGGITQITLQDPHGVMLELQFAGSAAG